MSTKVLALGDSWFHYPRGLDRDGNPIFLFKIRRWLGLIGDRGVGNIVYYLVNRNKLPLFFTETSVGQLWDAARSPTDSDDDVLGQCGEELRVMVTGTNRRGEQKHPPENTWLACLKRRIEKQYKDDDKFIILLSGGGNDIADKNLPDFLTDSGTHINEVEISKAIELLKGDYQAIFNTLSAIPGKKFEFILHGYAYPPVNGRGVITAFDKSSNALLQRLSPGPWLKPYFEKKGVLDRKEQENIIGNFIDRFNNMLKSLVASNVHYVDLLTVTDKVERNRGWCNELHFDHQSYVAAANTAYRAIQPLLLK